MQTYCFIGSDKNAGKTTAFTFVYGEMHRENRHRQLCVTGIGINGEDVDLYSGDRKPSIRLFKGSYFITRGFHLHQHAGKYETIITFGGNPFRRQYIMGRCLLEFSLVLEGPNSGNEVLSMKKRMAQVVSDDTVLLIDGSLDRQFLASPAISDMFYFSLLFSARKPQREKIKDFLFALQIPACSADVRKTLLAAQDSATRSLLFDAGGRICYHGKNIPYADKDLFLACKRKIKESACLYLKGAFTRSLHDFLAPFAGFEVVLDNYSLYQKVSTTASRVGGFRPGLSLLHPLRIRGLFVKQDVDFDPALFPVGVPVRNLFRQGGKWHASGI